MAFEEVMFIVFLVVQEFFTQAQKEQLATAIVLLLLGFQPVALAWFGSMTWKIRQAQKQREEREAEKERQENERKAARKQRVSDSRSVETGSVPTVPEIDMARPDAAPANST
jgi:Sec-independent protein translocase protein TatA